MIPRQLAVEMAVLVRHVDEDAIGFANAAARATSQPLRRMLSDRALACRIDGAALREAMVLPSTAATSIDAPARWPAIRDALGGCGDGALVEDCAVAEATTIAACDRLLAMALPRTVRTLLADAAARTRENHRVLRRLVALERDHVV